VKTLKSWIADLSAVAAFNAYLIWKRRQRRRQMQALEEK
jgi:hypothetical protein